MLVGLMGVGLIGWIVSGGHEPLELAGMFIGQWPFFIWVGKGRRG